MRSRTWLVAIALGAGSLALGACGSSSGSGGSGSSSGGSGAQINGAGSTFAAPIYQQWGSTLKQQGVTLNYQSIGSGAGVAELTSGTVDFGATDPPMKDQEISAVKKGKPVHIPMALGAITIAYNLPGVKAGLRLDPATIANIYLGTIKTWNAPQVSRLNPTLKLPATPITVVHRSDASGTTKGFTAFLVAHSPGWARVGSDKEVKWPTGTGGKGNDGVAAAVKQTPGAVGYVEQAYALQNGFTTAAVKNKAGQFVAPTLSSTTAAGEGVKVPPDLRFTVSDPPNPTAYPVVSQTFVVVYQDMCKAGLSKSTASGVAKFLRYGLGAGQQVLASLQYARLPGPVLTKARARVASLTCSGAPVSG